MNVSGADGAHAFANWLENKATSEIDRGNIQVSRSKQAVVSGAQRQSSPEKMIGFAKDILKDKEVSQEVKAKIRAHLLPALMKMAGTDRKELREVMRLAGNLLHQKGGLLTIQQRVSMASTCLNQLQTVDSGLRRTERKRWLPFSRASLDRKLIAKMERLTFKTPMVEDLADARRKLADPFYGSGSFMVYKQVEQAAFNSTPESFTFQAVVKVPGFPIDGLRPIEIPSNMLRSPANINLDNAGLWRQALITHGIAVQPQVGKDTLPLAPEPGDYKVVTEEGRPEKPTKLMYRPSDGSDPIIIRLDRHKGSILEKIGLALIEAKAAEKSSVDLFRESDTYNAFIRGTGVGVVVAPDQSLVAALPKKQATERTDAVKRLEAPLPTIGTANDIQRWALNQLGYTVSHPTLESLGDKDFVVMERNGSLSMFYKLTPESTSLTMIPLNASQPYFEQMQRELIRVRGG